MSTIKNIRVNEQIRVPKVRVVGEDGSQLGILSVQDALKIAYEKDLDLVEVAPAASPPVCKIMDFGKFKYQQEVSDKERKKKQTQIVIKEVKLRPKIDKNDLGIKKKQIAKFLEKGNKVKITMSFKGREIVHSEIGMNILNSLIEELGQNMVVEQRPKLEGHNIVVILDPV
jgi:translation initiation factor IF-3